MRLAVTIAIIIGVLNLGFLIYQAASGGDDARPVYSGQPIYYPRLDAVRDVPDNSYDNSTWYTDMRIRELEDRISQAENDRIWDRIYPDMR